METQVTSGLGPNFLDQDYYFLRKSGSSTNLEASGKSSPLSHIKTIKKLYSLSGRDTQSEDGTPILSRNRERFELKEVNVSSAWEEERFFSEKIHVILEKFKTNNDCQFSKEKLSKIKKATFLGPKMGWKLSALLYLTTLNHSLDKSPFYKDSVEIFKKSLTTEIATKQGLNRAPYLLAGFALIGALNSFLPLSDSFSTMNSVQQACVFGAVGLISSYAQNIIGLIYTGTNPDTSGQFADHKQDHIAKLKKFYTELGHELILQRYKNTDLSLALVEEIQLEQLFSGAERSGLNLNEAKNIFEEFQEAYDFIKNNKNPKSHFMNMAIKFYASGFLS